MVEIHRCAHIIMIHHCVINEQGYLRYEIQVVVYTAFEDIGAVENESDD